MPTAAARARWSASLDLSTAAISDDEHEVVYAAAQLQGGGSVMLLTMALILAAMFSVAALELWAFWRLGERDERRHIRTRAVIDAADAQERCTDTRSREERPHTTGASARWRGRLTSPAVARTATTLLQESTSLRPVDRPHVIAQHGATSRSDEVPVTSAARRALERDLASLRAKRREIPARLRIAREFGDTSNNDEHQAIREEEAVLAARIARLEGILARAADVDHADVADSVTIGAGVTVVDVDTREKLEYVVGSAHGALSRGTVSALSPVGQAVLGRRVGDRVSVQLPHGRRREFKLCGISPTR
jgi:transcription elongation factor GreA